MKRRNAIFFIKTSEPIEYELKEIEAIDRIHESIYIKRSSEHISLRDIRRRPLINNFLIPPMNMLKSFGNYLFTTIVEHISTEHDIIQSPKSYCTTISANVQMNKYPINAM
jgi:hypothetical protein